jgi:TolA-binding protein
MTSEPTEPRALTALIELLRGAVKKPTAAELDRGLQALRARWVGGNVNRRRVVRWSVLAAAVVTCVVSVAVVVSFRRTGESAAERPVSLSRIEGGKILDGGYLSESGNAGIKLFFDEGSEFDLEPGTRGRLRAVNADGAFLAIEHGSASLRITHRREHRWSVEAGPFLVTVKGTDFSVLWDPASEEFELKLRRGRVTVSGPVVGEGLALKPGQKLTVSLRKAETIITEERPDLAAGEASLPIPSPTAAASVARPAESGEPKLARARDAQPSPTASGAGTERRWREALAKGEWDEILADAERDGIEATLEKASSDDLFALADAARYRRRADLARLSLLAQRRRFPSSPRSLDAIFLLGRVEELRSSGRGSAIERYEEYLSRAPTGTYAAEALGRKMVLTKEVEGPASARPIAAEYLRRFPEGSYAGAARALERTP